MRNKSLFVALVCGILFGSPVSAQQKLSPSLSTCGRPRIVEAKPLDARSVEEMRGAGKIVAVDPVTGRAVFRHLTDFLPAGWGQGVASSEPADGFGHPIVNQVPGLPGWAERDVQALRAAIKSALATRRDGREADHVLGNYLGQAVARGLDVSDLVRLDGEEVSPAVREAIVAQLGFYENLKQVRAADWGYEYRPSVYGEQVEALIEAQGSSLAEVLSTGVTARGPAKVAPSGCYTKTTFTRGMSLLPAPIVLWQSSGEDDASADVPIGFSFNFYGCDDADPNFNVRVSTNGYLTFFEQGGGALDGTDFDNDAIPSTVDPDGFAAPYWDDLWIAPSQGGTDKVGYSYEGAVGSRIFTVEWSSVSRVGGDTSEYHSFQAKLVEATGDVELHFDTVWANDVADNATVGLEDFRGLDGDCGPNCASTHTGGTIPFNYRFAPPRPVNDSCGVLTGCLAADGPAVGTNLGATGSDVSSCGYNDIHDVWFWYHAPVTGTVSFDTCLGTNFDTTLTVFDQCTEGGPQTCGDDSCGSQSRVALTLTGGEDYYVRLAGYNGAQGTYRVEATPAVLPGGDTCGDAWTIGDSFSASTADNSGCLDESSCSSYDSVDEWVTVSAPASGPAYATTCAAGTAFDTTLAVFDACGGTELSCNDDDSGGGVCSTVHWNAVAGATYKLRVAGFHRGYGSYELKVSLPLFSDGFESGSFSAWSNVVGAIP